MMSINDNFGFLAPHVTYILTELFWLSISSLPVLTSFKYHSLDDAYLSRFQERLFIPKPSAEDRDLIWRHYAGNHCQLSETEWKRLVSETEGWTTRAMRGHIDSCKSRKEDVCRQAEFVRLIPINGELKFVPSKECVGAEKKGNLGLEHMYIPPMLYKDLSPGYLQSKSSKDNGRKVSFPKMMQLNDEERRIASGETSDEQMSDERYRSWMRDNKMH